MNLRGRFDSTLVMILDILQVKPIMEWFSSVAASAVIDKKFQALPDTFEVNIIFLR